MMAYLIRPRQKYESGGPVIPIQKPSPEEIKKIQWNNKLNLLKKVRDGMDRRGWLNLVSEHLDDGVEEDIITREEFNAAISPLFGQSGESHSKALEREDSMPVKDMLEIQDMKREDFPPYLLADGGRVMFSEGSDRVQYKIPTKISEANRATFMGDKKIPLDHNWKVQLPNADGNLYTETFKSKTAADQVIKKAPVIDLDYSKGLIEFKLPEGAINFDNSRYKIPTKEYVGEGKDKSQIFELRNKNPKSTYKKYFTTGAGGGKKILYDSIDDVIEAKLSSLPDEEVKVKDSSKRTEENIKETLYKNKKTGKITKYYKPMLAHNTVTMEGKGTTSLKEAQKFLADYYKENPKIVQVRDPEKDYKSKDIRRQFEKDLQGRTIKFNAPTGYTAHHMLPLAGRADVTSSDIAIISKEMNAELAQFDKPMNKLVNEAYALDFSKDGSLKRMDEINKELADIVAKSENKLPKKYKGLIGFNKLVPVLDTFDAKGNQVFDMERIGADYKKSIGGQKIGTPLRDMKTKDIQGLVQKSFKELGLKLSTEQVNKAKTFLRSAMNKGQDIFKYIPNKVIRKGGGAAAAALDYTLFHHLFGVPATEAMISAGGWLKPLQGKTALQKILQTTAMQAGEAEGNKQPQEEIIDKEETIIKDRPFVWKQGVLESTTPTYGEYANQIKDIKIP